MITGLTIIFYSTLLQYYKCIRKRYSIYFSKNYQHITIWTENYKCAMCIAIDIMLSIRLWPHKMGGPFITYIFQTINKQSWKPNNALPFDFFFPSFRWLLAGEFCEIIFCFEINQRELTTTATSIHIFLTKQKFILTKARRFVFGCVTL